MRIHDTAPVRHVLVAHPGDSRDCGMAAPVIRNRRIRYSGTILPPSWWFRHLNLATALMAELAQKSWTHRGKLDVRERYYFLASNSTPLFFNAISSVTWSVFAGSMRAVTRLSLKLTVAWVTPSIPEIDS